MWRYSIACCTPDGQTPSAVQEWFPETAGEGEPSAISASMQQRPSGAGTITCGVQSIRMATCSISSCRAGVTGRRRNVFSQAPQGLALRPTDADHRQTHELCRSEKANHARCRASPAQGSEQPCRTLASTDAATRKTDAPLQVTRPCTALFVGTRPDQQCLSVSAQPPVGAAVPARPC